MNARTPTRLRHITGVVCIFMVLIASASFAWDRHFLLTSVAVNALEDELPDLDKVVRPTTLASFVARNNEALKTALRLFHDWKQRVYPHPQWLLSDTNAALLRQPGTMSQKQFLEILGVAPAAFSKVVIPPGFDAVQNTALANPSMARRFGDWLVLFSDEPDWGMDQGLFGAGDPRYGEIPYGSLKGTGSQAPFHMYFPCENWISLKIKPSLKQGMTHLRFVAFANLAQVALCAGDRYWAARFLACTIHYLQDMTAPYHASAVPFLNPLVIAKAILAKDKDRFSRDNTQLLSNRHFLFEAVALRMQILGAAVPEKLYPGLSQKIASLCSARDKADEPPTTMLMKRFKADNKSAFDRAHKIDKLVSKAFPKKLVGDPSYDPFADGAFDVSPYFSDASVQSWIDGRRNRNTPLLNEIGDNLSNAVEATLATLLAVLR
ncbi:MAG TPA: hypothetical protein PLU72_03685 [Candidatus Ozemobacteraceae bacterium]|nr:hypothetical protein [Candidatus Ozemobacteraceae bacterium]